MPLSPGQIINNRYRIVKMLGQGGYGAVYRAWDMNMERARALKENLDTSPEAQRQFKREAQILGDLTHPNLPKVIDQFFIPEQGQYLVMEFVEGQDLQEMLDKHGGPLPESQVVEWIGQVCDALSYLHSQVPPIIHRDIKPANIKITPQNKAMLVDFGIAKIYDENLVTTKGARAITSGYSPPEQYGMGNTDARSDVYALGATCFALLTGRIPPDSVDIVIKRVESRPTVLGLNPQVTLELSAAIEKAMQPDCSQRYQTIAEFKAGISQPLKVAYFPAKLEVQPTMAPAEPEIQPTLMPAKPEIQSAIAPAKPASRPIPWAWIGAISALLLVGLILMIAVFIGINLIGGRKGSATQTSVAQVVVPTLFSSSEPTLIVSVPPVLSPTGDSFSTQTAEVLAGLASQTAMPSATQGVRNAPPSAPIALEDWSNHIFVEISSGCETTDAACWRGKCGTWSSDNPGAGGRSKTGSATLTSEKGIFIDPEWEKPYLVYWNKYNFFGDANFIMVKVDGRWEYLTTFKKGSSEVGGMEFIDLGKYKGRNISITFSTECAGSLASSTGTSDRYTEWYLQNIQIVPAFVPPQ